VHQNPQLLTDGPPRDGVAVLVHHDGGVFVGAGLMDLDIAVGDLGLAYQESLLGVVALLDASRVALHPVGAVGKALAEDLFIELFQTGCLRDRHHVIAACKADQPLHAAFGIIRQIHIVQAVRIDFSG